MAKKLTPMRAIRAKCLDCSADSYREVKLCSIESCPLWHLRSGHRPKAQSDRGGAENAEAPRRPVPPAFAENRKLANMLERVLPAVLGAW